MTNPMVDQLRELALSMPGAWEDHPWHPVDSVYKNAKGKIFLFLGEDDQGAHATVKLTPEENVAALTLPFVEVAPYVGRYGWVLARLREQPELEVTLEWVGRSYDLVSGKRKAKS
ncbi:MAG: MmcQ/YjbR family DNA-binding protein [Dehalococcoidia bacterium]